MRRTVFTGVSAIALAAGAPAYAQGQPAAPMTAEEAAALRAEVEALRQQVAALAARLDATAAVAATSAPANVTAPAPVVAAATPAPAAPAAPETSVAWRGAPEWRSAGGWSFKPRGRLQVDVGGVDVPSAADSTGLGYGAEIRRLQVGVDGTMPGGFAYRLEADVADNSLTLTDTYLAYSDGGLTVTLGQHKPFFGIEEQTSDLFTSFAERAAFTQAFGFERRVGVSVQYVAGDVMVQGGLFADDVSALSNATDNSWSIDGRVVYAPRLGGTQLHFGLSGHSRDFNDSATSARYRTRPFTHTTDVRLVDTGSFAATGESGWGAEFAAIRGRWHVAGEAAWLRARRAGLVDPTFTGGYAEAGLFLTDDSRTYRRGTFDRVTPRAGVGNGGTGAIELNLRYDWVDLNDGTISGGEQSIYGASLTWILTPYVRFLAGYGRVELEGSRLPAAGDTDYGADAVTLRAQFDF